MIHQSTNLEVLTRIYTSAQDWKVVLATGQNFQVSIYGGTTWEALILMDFLFCVHDYAINFFFSCDMNRIFWNHEVFNKLYNCSFLTTEEWYQRGEKHVIVGLSYIILGVIFELLYIPFLVVMLQPEFIKHSCYKIMFFIGVLDVLVLVEATFVSGAISIRGEVFCTNPYFIYINGCFGMSIWAGTCMGCILLTFDRCLDLLSPYYSQKLFSGNKTWYWMILPSVYMLCFWIFSSPNLDTSIFDSWYFDPYAGIHDIDQYVNHNIYANYSHTANNIGMVIIMFVEYFALCVILAKQIKGSNSITLTMLQKQTLIQAIYECSIIFFACIMYVYMNYLPTPLWFNLVAEYAWIFCHGGSVLIFIFINRSMRVAVKRLVIPKILFNSSQAAINITARSAPISVMSNNVNSTVNPMPNAMSSTRF